MIFTKTNIGNHLDGLTRIIDKQCPAANGRFGVMAAVPPQTRQCKLETLYPAGSVVEAATTPSRWDVSGNPRTAQRENERQLIV